MSLLPNFNQKFRELCAPKSDLSFSTIGLTTITFRKASDLLNPDLNPLTFEEVKEWFDERVRNSTCVYHNKRLLEYLKESAHWYEIFWANHYYILPEGYTKSHLADTKKPFSELLTEFSGSPLYLFCQMKGYVD
jgi:hypothetical protein